MRAVLFTKYGPPSTLLIVEVEKPIFKDLVKGRAEGKVLVTI